MGDVGTLIRRGFGETSRRDRWWVQPLVVFVVLSSFIGYTTWAGFPAKNYFYHEDGAPYLSPPYPPLLHGPEPTRSGTMHNTFSPPRQSQLRSASCPSTYS